MRKFNNQLNSLEIIRHLKKKHIKQKMDDAEKNKYILKHNFK